MPNYSDTTIKFYGKKEAIQEIAINFEKSGFDFGPTSEQKKNQDWYEWRLAHWGTKWNADSEATHCVSNDGDNAIFDISLLSAWNGPHIWFKTI